MELWGWGEILAYKATKQPWFSKAFRMSLQADDQESEPAFNISTLMLKSTTRAQGSFGNP